MTSFQVTHGFHQRKLLVTALFKRNELFVKYEVKNFFLGLQPVKHHRGPVVQITREGYRLLVGGVHIPQNSLPLG